MPHLVPVTFAVGDGVYVAVDHKPKRTHDLRRLRNIRDDPLVSLLADGGDAGGCLPGWWVRADGVAEVTDGRGVQDERLDLLAAKYPQYRERRPSGPVIVVQVSQWTGWADGDGPPGSGDTW